MGCSRVVQHWVVLSPTHSPRRQVFLARQTRSPAAATLRAVGPSCASYTALHCCQLLSPLRWRGGTELVAGRQLVCGPFLPRCSPLEGMGFSAPGALSGLLLSLLILRRGIADLRSMGSDLRLLLLRLPALFGTVPHLLTVETLLSQAGLRLWATRRARQRFGDLPQGPSISLIRKLPSPKKRIRRVY